MLGTSVQLKALAIECADTPVWPLTDSDVIACLHTLHQAEQALTAAKLHLIHQLDTRGLPKADHATNTTTWLRQHLRISTRTARHLATLARGVDQHPTLDQALTAATINTEQAGTILSTVTDLPTEVGTEITAKAEAVLIDWATQFNPHALHRLGTRILDHVAPDIADQADAAALARQEARAYSTRTLSLTPTGDGRVRLTGWLDTEAAAIFTAALDALSTPRHTSATQPYNDNATRDERTPGQRRADALTDICRLALNTGELPTNGGDRPQLSITITYDALRRQLGTATLDTGERLTATQARRLACDAHLLPAVLGTQGQILDLGQSRRLITGPLRRALVLRDHGCTFPGCDRPPRWCEGHHITPWTDGGPTTLDNSVLLCPHHHRLIHHSDWTVRLARDRRPEFLPPPHLDPHQQPRRNPYHHRT